ncbi:MAG: SRPBCC family protein, partial [Acidimicrobiales bacterium]
QRQWETEIVEQQPGRRIAWRAKGGIQAKGVVTFHRLDTRLTHLSVNIEYKPSGFMETIGNFFRMQRRRVRKDLKLFKNYIDIRGEATDKGPGRVRGDGLKGDVDQQVDAAQAKDKNKDKDGEQGDDQEQ